MPTAKIFASAGTCVLRSTAILFSLLFLAPYADAAPEYIQPADVFARTTLVRVELEKLRFHMGKPEVSPPVFTASDVSPHEAYFQALALFRNANQLCFDHTGKHTEAPPLPAGAIRPANVYELVDTALQLIVTVRSSHISGDPPVQGEIDPKKSPTDVFNLLVQSNRQLNLLLDSRVAPRQVFSQVTFATGYAACLLEPFPEFDLLPEAPPYEPGKRPHDVFRRLLICLEQVNRISHESGVAMLKLSADEARVAEVEPSDVYYLSTLVVAELANLHSRLEGARQPPEFYEVGRKVPADVFQRVGMLEKQLALLEQYVQFHPDWLRQGSEK